jgi:PAS domain-containing protein
MNATEQRHTRDLVQQVAEGKATIDALLAGQIDAVFDVANGTPVLLAKAQKALMKSEERFREQAALFDTAHDAIYVRGLDGRITYWNKGAEQAYDRQLLVSSTGGELSPTKLRGADALQSLAVVGTQNDRRP